ncbi:SUF system Fe-S cluster assembly protein [Apibacter sp. B3706]|uniref:SUF system Fe-S cluster assembly protein n=1 Tax=Apibacter TaxID=1778601 RepID=UPI00135E5964|nr:MULTISPECIES: SUF system Fe-S cluster assembly protein [Apibacter]MXP06479.1 SUF system Fe-S cluster assembly protein [Apibacter sp. B3546]MXP12704.1 SUF system Fe-S cluster assembly protein [Apibacter sp. B3239]QII69277.1 SUF system Fe-S cluster assembly protein [Apibacter sp. B3706]QII71126.1 SUF system Fe-S cluster assembly protein [Apibacter sp. B3706]
MSLNEEQIQSLSEKIVEKLKTVYDPEIPVDVYELGLIYDIQISTEGDVEILMTLTTPNCPVAETLPMEVEEKISAIDEVKEVNVKITFEPTWDKDMMSEEAKFNLGLL